jgi:hypothetical protein
MPYSSGFSESVLTQLHCHTNQSDGSFTPAQVVDKYLAAGYGALAITDHDKVTAQPAGLASPISGNELSPTTQHILSIGASYTRGALTDAQQIIDGITAAGGHAVIAHPEWSVGLTYEEMAALTGYRGMEIHNAKVVTGAGQNPITFPGYSLSRWDLLLTRSRRDIWGVSTDDLHAIDTYHAPDVGRTHVFVTCNSPVNVTASLASGDFVADVSNHGVTPGYPVVDAEGVSVTCPGATRVEAWGPFGLLAAEDANSLSYGFNPCDRYVRLVAVGDYTEPFDTLSDQWAVHDGSWAAANGTLQLAGDGTGRRIILRRHREGDFTASVRVKLGNGGLDQGSLMFNVLNSNYYYLLFFGQSSNGGYNNTLAIAKATSGVPAAAPLAATPLIAAPDTWYTLSMAYTSGLIRAKAWADGDPEPEDWQVSVTDSAWRHGAFGFRSTYTAEYDDLYINGFKTYYQPIPIG